MNNNYENPDVNATTCNISFGSFLHSTVSKDKIDYEDFIIL